MKVGEAWSKSIKPRSTWVFFFSIYFPSLKSFFFWFVLFCFYLILFGNASDRWIESIAPGRKGDEHDNDGYFQCDSFFFHLLFDQPNMAALWELVKGDDTWFPSFPVACVRVQNWVLLHVSCKDGVSFLFSFLFFCLLGFFSVTGLGHHWQAKRTANELEASPRASSLTNPL